MNTQMTTAPSEGYNFALQNFEDAMRFAEMMSSSGVCPAALKGRPNDVLAIIQSGHEIGLKPMQALRTLGVVNGVTFAHGDGLVGLAQRHPDWEGMEVWMTGQIDAPDYTAHCTVKRKNMPDITKSYSMGDARAAALLGKPNWVNRQRMLQRRAMSYALKDQFADAIMGLYMEDEARDIAPTISAVLPINKGLKGLKESMGLLEQKPIEQEIIVSEEMDVEPTSSLLKLQQMIERLYVPQKTIDLWLKKAKVESVEDLTETQLQKCIAHLKTKEEQDAIHTAFGTGVKSDELSGTGDV